MRFDAHEGGKFVARIIDRRARFASRRMHARCIAKVPIEVRQHHLAGLIAQRRSRVVIEINHFVLLLLLMHFLLLLLTATLRGAKRLQS